MLAVDLVEHLGDLLAGPVQPLGAAGAAGRLIGVILGVDGHLQGLGVEVGAGPLLAVGKGFHLLEEAIRNSYGHLPGPRIPRASVRPAGFGESSAA